MASNARGSMRSYGSSRSPSFVLIGLLVVIVILGFNYWNASSRNSILTTDVKALTATLDRLKSNFKKRSDAMLDKIGESDHEKSDAKRESENAKSQLAVCTDNLADTERNLDTVKSENDDIDRQMKECEANVTELIQKCQTAEEEAKRAASDKMDVMQQLEEYRKHQDKNCDSESDAVRLSLLTRVFSLFGQQGIMLLKQAGVNVEGIDLSISKSPLYQISPFGQAALKIPDSQNQQLQQHVQQSDITQPQQSHQGPPGAVNPPVPDQQQGAVNLDNQLNPAQLNPAQLNPAQHVQTPAVQAQLPQQNQIGVPPGHREDGAGLLQQPEVGQNENVPGEDSQVQLKGASKEVAPPGAGHQAPLGVTSTPQESKEEGKDERPAGPGVEDQQEGKDDRQADGMAIPGAIAPNDPLNPENKVKAPTEQTGSEDAEQKADNPEEQKEEAKEGGLGNLILSENMNPGERKFQEVQDDGNQIDQDLRFKQGEQGLGPIGDTHANMLRQAAEEEVEMSKRDRGQLHQPEDQPPF